jgi:alpha,alpha-trehalase
MTALRPGLAAAQPQPLGPVCRGKDDTVRAAITSGFAPQVLREYALLADGERGALVGPQGDLAWMCAPRWDSDAVFSSLIGGQSCYAVTPVQRHVWGGYYERAA